MKLKVKPSSIDGVISAPPSKSYTHRALFISLLTSGESLIKKPLISGDTLASIEAIKSFGARFTRGLVKGVGEPIQPERIVNCRSSATTMRFSIAVSALVNGMVVLSGSKSLLKRPMKDLIDALKSMGARVYSRNGYPPITVVGGINRDETHRVEISGKISSQFISALLIISPRIGLDINISNELKSKPYVDMTIKFMEKAGVKVDRIDYSRFVVEKQDYRETTFNIPGDYSSSSFILAAGALFGKVGVRNLQRKDVQGDKAIINVLKSMGCKVYFGNKALFVEKSSLEGVEVDCSDTPDLAPIISVLACYAKGKTVIKGVKRLRFKESNRVENVYVNLRKMGGNLKIKEDSLIIEGVRELKPSTLNPMNDHRIAMALTIAAMGAKGESTIINSECIYDSYPEFINDLRRLGGKLEVNHDR